MKRFYRDVSLSDDHAVLLDSRPVKTPRKAALRLPNRALAEAVAAEWEAQHGTISPLTMPMTRLANTAIDRVGAEREKILGELVAFAGADLVCYRAAEPSPLVGLQAAHWDPVIDWARRALDAPFTVTSSIMHVQQADATIAAYARHVGARDDFAVTALHNLATLTGSALLAAMIEAGAIPPELAWAAANVDEDWQVSQWGEDEEAANRTRHRKAEFDTCCLFLARLAGGERIGAQAVESTKTAS